MAMRRDLAGRMDPAGHRRSRLSPAEHGAVAIEYALLGAIVALGIVTALQWTRQSLNSDYDKISYAVGKAVPDVSKAPRVVASTYNETVNLNGIRLDRVYSVYTDGTKSMVQTNSNNTAIGWGVAKFEYDTAGNMIGLSVTNPDGSFQYSQVLEQVRAGVSVSTITDASGVPYAFQSTMSASGAIGTETRVMTQTNGRTDLWLSQVITTDYSDPANLVSRATCTYSGGRTVAC